MFKPGEYSGDVVYLIGAHVDTNGNIIKNTALPMSNTFIGIDDPKNKVATTILKDGEPQVIKESHQIYTTDEYGVIRNFNTGKKTNSDNKSEPFTHGTTIKAFSRDAKLYFPPPRLLMYHLAAEGYDKWIGSLREQMKSLINNVVSSPDALTPDVSLADQIKQVGDATFLEKQYLVADTFVKPKKSQLSDEEQAYADWFNLNSDKKIRAIILPRTRAIFVVFSGKEYLNAEVRIKNRRGLLDFFNSPILQPGKPDVSNYVANVEEIKDNDGKVIGYGAILFDSALRYNPDASAEDQIYRIEVQLLERNADILGLKSPKYELAERLRFAINNMSGEFELINGDAISLEETLIKQFPVVYQRIIEQATATDNPILGAQGITKKNPAVTPYLHGLKTTLDYSKLATDVVGAESTAVSKRIMGKFLFDNIKDINGVGIGNVNLSDIVNLAFNVYDTTGSIAEKISDIKKKWDSANPLKIITAADKISSTKQALEKSKLYDAVTRVAATQGIKADDLLDKIKAYG